MRRTTEQKQNQMRERWSKRPGPKTKVPKPSEAPGLILNLRESEVLKTDNVRQVLNEPIAKNYNGLEPECSLAEVEREIPQVHFPIEMTLDEFRRKRRRLFDELQPQERCGKNLIECQACKDVYPKRMSELTGQYCEFCFLELAFGIVPPCYTSIGGGTPFYYRSDDEDPMLHNCIRILEGDK